MLNHYREYHHEGLLILAIGLAFTCLAPFAHFGYFLFHHTKYEGVVTGTSALMISFLITGAYIYTIGLNRLVEQRTSRQIAGLAPIYLMGLILNAAVIRHKYINGNWRVVYIPNFAFYIFGTLIVLIQLDICSLVYSLVSDSKIIRVKQVYYTASSVFLLLIPLLILRKYATLPQNIFLLPLSFFFLLFTILIAYYPLVFFSSSASPYLLVIYDSTSMQILQQYTFLDKENEKRSEFIFGQLINFYDILENRTFSSDLRQIQLTSMNYYFDYNHGLNYVLAMNHQSDSYKILLYELAREINSSKQLKLLSEKNQSDSFDSRDIELALDKIFIHQLNRLRLIKKSIDETTHNQFITFLEQNETLKTVFHPIRLTIIQILYENQVIPRSELRHMLQINSGSLTQHLELLLRAEYIHEDIKFLDNKPRKIISITQQGITNYSLFKQQIRIITKLAKSL